MNKISATQNVRSMNAVGDNRSQTPVENKKLKQITENFEKAWAMFTKEPHVNTEKWGIESSQLLHDFGKKMYQASNEELMKSVTIDAMNFTTPVYQGLRAMGVKNVFEILKYSKAQLMLNMKPEHVESLIKVLAKDRGITLYC